MSISQSSSNSSKPVRISYLTEQTSHHPPVSAFYIDCPEKGVHAKGFDQITAKFTGTSIRVSPGEHNLGIFITVERRNHETYQLTHPAAHLGGFLRGALNVTVGDMCYVTCPETKLKAILHYYDEGWTRTVNKVEGIIFRYDPENDDKQRIADVPESDILIRLGGPWKEKIVFTIGPKPLVSRLPTVPSAAPLVLTVSRTPILPRNKSPSSTSRRWRSPLKFSLQLTSSSRTNR